MKVPSKKHQCLERIEKHSIECPNYFVTTLQFEKQIKHEEGEHEVAKKQDRSKQKHQKSRGQYTNWFQPHLWPHIIVAIQKYDTNIMLCITCKLLTKVQEFQVHIKNWQKIVCGLGLHQK
jgi:hypothetical protein